MDPFSTTLKDKNLGMYLIRLSWDTYYLIVSSLEEENLTERRGSNGSRNFDLGRLKLVEEFEGGKFRGKKKGRKEIQKFNSPFDLVHRGGMLKDGLLSGHFDHALCTEFQLWKRKMVHG